MKLVIMSAFGVFTL